LPICHPLSRRRWTGRQACDENQSQLVHEGDINARTLPGYTIWFTTDSGVGQSRCSAASTWASSSTCRARDSSRGTARDVNHPKPQTQNRVKFRTCRLTSSSTLPCIRPLQESIVLRELLHISLNLLAGREENFREMCNSSRRTMLACKGKWRLGGRKMHGSRSLLTLQWIRSISLSSCSSKNDSGLHRQMETGVSGT
jgi:hypothetical protein